MEMYSVALRPILPSMFQQIYMRLRLGYDAKLARDAAAAGGGGNSSGGGGASAAGEQDEILADQVLRQLHRTVIDVITSVFNVADVPQHKQSSVAPPGEPAGPPPSPQGASAAALETMLPITDLAYASGIHYIRIICLCFQFDCDIYIAEYRRPSRSHSLRTSITYP